MIIQTPFFYFKSNIPIKTIEWLKWANLHLNKINPLKGTLPIYTKAEEILKIKDIN